MCPGLRLEGLGWSARPIGDTPRGGQAQSPAFAPGSPEVAAGVLVFQCLAVQNLPLSVQLLLVPCVFFAFCCWRRGDSRCKHRDKGFQVPACLNTRAWPGSLLM